MEIPGDVFKPFLGLVNQTTKAPIGRLTPWKMTRTTLDLERDKVDTPNNAVPDFKTSINAKRGTTGKIEQASFDPLFNIYGGHPFVAVAPLRLQEGWYIRALMVPDTSIAGPIGIGDVIGTPILGLVGELIAAIPPGDIYIFLALRVTKIHHMADAAAGQPFDFDFETVHAYRVPGESMQLITTYGFSPTVGAGGFF